MIKRSRVWRWLSPKKNEAVDRFEIASVTHPAELDHPDGLPVEIRFVMAKHPERKILFSHLLASGYGLGIRTVDKTPEAILEAVDAISHLTQENTVIPWLPRLLRDGELPVFLEDELRAGEQRGVALYERARLILERRYEFKKFVLIDLHNRGLGKQEQDLMRELNEDLYPYAIDYIVHRVVFDNAHTRTEAAQSIIKALIIIGPIAHVLEGWTRGIGKLFAASADDMLSEVAELFALRGSGFTWRQLLRRSRILIPVFALATWGAFSVEGLFQQGRVMLAGAVFGLSAVALSLTTALQSIQLYRRSFAMLLRRGKLAGENRSLWRLALVQDFTNPARLGLFFGAMASPLLAGTAFVFLPSFVHNGWALALLGSVESVVAGGTVIAASAIHRATFARRIRRAIVKMENGARERENPAPLDKARFSR